MPDESIYRQLFESVPDAVIVAGTDGVIQVWNAGAEVLFGHTSGEAIGKTLDLIIPEKQRDRHWQGYDKALESGETRYGRDLLSVPAVHRDGRRISLEFTVALLKNGEGAVEGVAAILRDATARFERDKARAQELADLKAKLAAAAG